MHGSMLKLKADKTEVILFTSKCNANLVSDISVNVGVCEIKPTTSVRNLGAILDSRIDLEQHVNSVCRSCYVQLRQIGHIRRYLTSDATKYLVNSLVTSKLDYCYVLLNGLPNAGMK